MVKRYASVVFILSLCLGSAAYAGEWTSIQKDATHTGFLPVGVHPPLRRVWKFPREPLSATWPVVAGDKVFASIGKGVSAVNAENGQLLWRTDIPEGQDIVGLAVEGEHLLVPALGGSLLALNVNTGKEVWRFNAERNLGPGAAAAFDSVVVTSPESHRVFSLDTTSGSVKWEVQLEGEPSGFPVVTEKSVVVLSQNLDTSESEVVSMSLLAGEEEWSFKGTFGVSSPAILDDKVIVGGGDFNAYALDIKTGKVVWKSRVYGKFDGRNMPALAYGDAFLADRVGNVYRINGKTGKRIWMFDKTIGTFDQSSPVVVGKTVYIGSSAGWLYALDADSGELRWKEQVGGFILSGAADEERFYFGVKFGKAGLYAYEHDPKGKLEPNTGKLALWVALGVIAVLLVGIVYLVRRKRLPNL